MAPEPTATPVPFSAVEYVRPTFGRRLSLAVEREVFRRGWMALPDAASFHTALAPLDDTLFEKAFKELSYAGLQRHVHDVLLTQLHTYVSEPEPRIDGEPSSCP